MTTIQRLGIVAGALALILISMLIYRWQGASAEPPVSAVEIAQQSLTLTPVPPRAEPATQKPRPTATANVCELNVEASVRLGPPPGYDSIDDRPPIPYITFHLVEEKNKVPPMTVQSDLEGKVNFHQSLPGCPKVSFMLYPDIPHGYHRVSPDKYDGIAANNRPFTYQFVIEVYRDYPIEIMPTPMPAGRQPKVQVNTEQGPTCEAVLGDLENSPKYAEFLALAPDGSIWVNEGQNFKWYEPGANEWKVLAIDDGLEHEYGIDRFEFSPEGVLWLGTWDEGVSSYDGSTWRSYDVSDGLFSGSVDDISFGKDGQVWFATFYGDVSSFNPSTGAWHTYSLSSTDTYDFVYLTRILSVQDGSIWFGSLEGAIRLRFPSGNPNEPEWVYFTWGEESSVAPSFKGQIVELPFYNNDVSAMEQTPDGTIWFGWEGVLGFAADAQQTKLIGETSFYVGDLEAASDGTLWANTDVGLVHIYPDREPGAPDAWTTYDFKEIAPRYLISDIAVVDDQNIWIVFNGVPMLCNFP